MLPKVLLMLRISSTGAETARDETVIPAIPCDLLADVTDDRFRPWRATRRDNPSNRQLQMAKLLGCQWTRGLSQLDRIRVLHDQMRCPPDFHLSRFAGLAASRPASLRTVQFWPSRHQPQLRWLSG